MEERVRRDGAAVVAGHVREGERVHGVPGRVDPLAGGRQAVVDLHGAAVVELHADGVETELLRLRIEPGRHHRLEVDPELHLQTADANDGAGEPLASSLPH